MKTSEKSEIDEARIQQYFSTFPDPIPPADQKKFTELAIKLQLDPFERDIHLSAWKNSSGKVICSTVIGYEVYLKRAERTALLDGWEKGIKVVMEGDTKVMLAWIKIYRKDWKFPLYHEVYFNEYVQYKGTGQNRVKTKFWLEKGRTMIQKVVISQGFRLAFPEDCGGLPYTADELPPQESVKPPQNSNNGQFREKQEEKQNSEPENSPNQNGSVNVSKQPVQEPENKPDEQNGKDKSSSDNDPKPPNETKSDFNLKETRELLEQWSSTNELVKVFFQEKTWLKEGQDVDKFTEAQVERFFRKEESICLAFTDWLIIKDKINSL